MNHKVLIVGDTHFGARNNNPVFNEYFIRVFEDEIFPLLDRENIKTIVQLGDLFDNRKTLSLPIFADVKKRVFDILAINGVNVITLVGNHDSAKRDSINVNAQQLFLGEYNNITVVSNPKVIGSFSVVPWICEDNREECLDFINQHKTAYCVGHFELDGFPMYKGSKIEHGQTIDALAKFDRVFSGHYHTPSMKGNVQYVGTPYEITWADCNDQKQVLILDTGTGEVQSVPIQTKMHYIINYKDRDAFTDQVAGKCVKVVVEKQQMDTDYDMWIQSISDQMPLELRVIVEGQSSDDVESKEATSTSLNHAVKDYFGSKPRGDEKLKIFETILHNIL